MSKLIVVFSGLTLLLAAALVVQASLPGPEPLAVNKQIRHGPWTITITGDLMVDRTSRTVTGTLMAVVTDAEGNVVATAEGTLNIVNGAGTAEFHLSIPALGVDITVTINIMDGTVSTSLVDRHVRKLMH